MVISCQVNNIPSPCDSFDRPWLWRHHRNTYARCFRRTPILLHLRFWFRIIQLLLKALQCLAMILNQKVACSCVLFRAAPWRKKSEYMERRQLYFGSIPRTFHSNQGSHTSPNGTCPWKASEGRWEERPPQNLRQVIWYMIFQWLEPRQVIWYMKFQWLEPRQVIWYMKFQWPKNSFSASSIGASICCCWGTIRSIAKRALPLLKPISKVSARWWQTISLMPKPLHAL